MPTPRLPLVTAALAMLLALTPLLIVVAADGSLTPHPSAPSFGTTGTLNVALGDLDGDGDTDAVVTGAQESVWLNSGDGSFSAHPTAPTFGSATDATYDVALGDLDGDGDLDAVIVNGPDPGAVWLNDGIGALTPHPTVPTFSQDGGLRVALGDIDGDGDLDAVVARGTVPQMVWVNDGTGALTSHPTQPSFGNPNEAGVSIALGDLDGDGDLDAVVGQSASPSTIWLNDGAGVFTPHPVIPGIGFSITIDLVLGDLDEDGDLDVVLGNTQSLGSTVWLNDGTGAMIAHPAVPSVGPAVTQTAALADLDDDGDLDLVLANVDSPSTVWVNDGSGEFAPHPLVPSIGTGNEIAIALADLDGDSDIDAVLSNTVWINGTSTIVADVVGDGTPESCTEAALDAALAGGGLITFDCGSTPDNPLTIPITQRKETTMPTSIDGGESIVLSGGGTTGVFVALPESVLTLANLTIRDGRATLGGAVANDRATLIVDNVRFENNLATDSGGAIASGIGSLTITNSLFEGNRAHTLGGAILIAEGVSASISNSTFLRNQAGRHAGAIMADGRNILVTDCQFTENLSIQAGGSLYVTGRGDVTVVDSTFTGNESDHIEGGENLGGAAIRNDGLLRVLASTITNNTGQYGGGIMSAGDLTISNSTVAENGAIIDGGGLYVIQGQAFLERSDVSRNLANRNAGGIENVALTSIVDSTLDGNQAGKLGGGIHAFQFFSGASSTNIEQTTISNNLAGGGGGIFSATSAVIRSSTFVGNAALDGGAVVATEGTNPEFPTVVLIQNSTLSGNLAVVRGGGIFTNVAYVGLLHSTIVGNEVAPEAVGLARDAASVASPAAPDVDVALLRDRYHDSSGHSDATITVIDSVHVTFSNTAERSSALLTSGEATRFPDGTNHRGDSWVHGNSGDQRPEALAAESDVGGAGIFNNGVVDLMGTIVANSLQGADCVNFDGQISSRGNNIDGDGSCFLVTATDHPATNPRIGELVDNGGPTLTHALLAGSPAIDAGATGCTYTDFFPQQQTATVDQRAVPRSQGTGCDIGAYEAFQASGPEGSPIEIKGSSDPKLGPSPEYSWSLDPDAPCTLSTVDAQDTTVTCDDNVVVTATLVATDGDRRGQRVIDQVIVTTMNVAPALHSTPGGVISAQAGEPVIVDVPWSDPGTADTITCSVVWSDGTNATVDGGTGGSGTCNLLHTFTAAGSYSATIRAIDDDGGTVSVTTQVVVTRKNAALVVGAGVFNSPAGAYANNPRLRGSVGFVFTVADPANKPTPSGTLVVTLTAGRQVFMSDEIDWMVTTASAAQFHGTGRINGAAGYRFTVTAIDGRPDRIRISVWDASGTVVYDNRPGLPLDLELADPQPINSGVVLIIN